MGWEPPFEPSFVGGVARREAVARDVEDGRRRERRVERDGLLGYQDGLAREDIPALHPAPACVAIEPAAWTRKVAVCGSRS